MKHVQEPLPDLRSLNPDLPPPIADVIAWALAKAPTDRPADASALAEGLRAAALQCGLALPERVDLPERELPAVISGEARHGFPGLARQDAATETPLAQGAGRAQPSRTGPAVFAGLATLFLANLLSIGFAGMLGSFPAIVGRLWPFEILWLAFLFSLIAWARRGTGMLTPIGITLAVGLPSLYYGLSGDWGAWWWWVFAVAATPTAILSAYALARRDPPRSVARLNAGLVVLTGAICAVAIVALLFVLPPFFNPARPGLAGLFIPGMSILAVSVLLLASQLVTPGFIWSRFWPMILVALAIGFGLLGAFLRNIWLAVPAALTLTLGAGLQVTALTGWWWMWAGLWALLPLALGLTLLAIGLARRRAGLRLAGGILMLIFGTAGVGLVLLALLLWQAAGVVLGTGFTLAGLWLLWAAFVRRPVVEAASASPNVSA